MNAIFQKNLFKKYFSIKYIFTVTLILSLSTFGTSFTAQAQQQQNQTEYMGTPYGTWILHCLNNDTTQAACFIRQIARTKQKNWLQQAIGYMDGERPMLVLQHPSTVDASQPVMMDMKNGGGRTFDYSACDDESCFVYVFLDSQSLRVLKNLGNTTIIYTNLDRQKISAQINFDGFKQGFEALKKLPVN